MDQAVLMLAEIQAELEEVSSFDTGVNTRRMPRFANGYVIWS